MEFFAATSPGLEPLCLRELQALSLVAPEGRAAEGGVSFDGRLHGSGWTLEGHEHGVTLAVSPC